jgi:Glycosyltransferase family 6
MTNITTKRTIGIITIATGKYYAEFIPNLKDSIDLNFATDQYQIHFYCFTDVLATRADIQCFPIAHFGWPFSTLLRYHWINEQLPTLLKHDFLLYLDADMKVVAPLPDSIFDNELIAVEHPGFMHAGGAFEIDRQESSYTPPQLRKTYYQGCCWGGKTTAFKNLIQTLNSMVETDLKNAAIPIWHDESYLNHYLALHACTALPPTFAWPQGESPIDPPYILHLEKAHGSIRQTDSMQLNVIELLSAKNMQDELKLYKKLYLVAHEKCQRLEDRLAKKNLWWLRLREWLAYYKKSPDKNSTL